MPVLMQQTLPEGTTLDMVAAVNAEMGVDNDPPAGLIVHTTHEADGRIHIVDVWESEQDIDRFGEQRLGPAVAKVMAANGFPPPAEEPTRHVTPVAHLLVGR